jgi:hypothetical protein
MHMTCASEILGQRGDRVETAFVGESGNGHLAHGDEYLNGLKFVDHLRTFYPNARC